MLKEYKELLFQTVFCALVKLRKLGEKRNFNGEHRPSALFLHYMDQFVNVLVGNNNCLFWELYDTETVRKIQKVC
jgi:hypothetical protein